MVFLTGDIHCSNIARMRFDNAAGVDRGIFAYDIDDLQQAVTSHVADRRKEAERAEAIIASEVEKFEARSHTLDVVPTIVSLQDHLETIRQAEIDRVRGRMGQLVVDNLVAFANGKPPLTPVPETPFQRW